MAMAQKRRKRTQHLPEKIHPQESLEFWQCPKNLRLLLKSALMSKIIWHFQHVRFSGCSRYCICKEILMSITCSAYSPMSHSRLSDDPSVKSSVRFLCGPGFSLQAFWMLQMARSMSCRFKMFQDCTSYGQL